MIPKILHQTWKDETIPEKWIDAVNSCKNLYSDFTYMLWTDEKMEEFIKNKHSWFYETYISYPHHIQRCDAFRYFVLYTYGGLYLDMDIACIKKINDFLKYDAVLVKSPNVETVYTNMFFAFSKGNPFLKFCIEHLEKSKNSADLLGKHLHVMSSTGPVFLTDRITEYGEIDNVHVLSNQGFAGDCSICNVKKGCKGGTNFKHVEGSSWVEWDSRLYAFVFCNYKPILFLLFLLGVLFYMS
jgi:mannosyltransferase OCH1-like enzyme